MEADGAFVHGPGISIAGRYTKTDARELDALREQNAQLKEQVEHLSSLLRTRQDISSGKDVNRCDCCNVSEFLRRVPYRCCILFVSEQMKHRPQPCESCSQLQSTTHVLQLCYRFATQFFKCQIAQLQRQVVLLQTEIRARNKLVREAETMLLECLTQIEPLAEHMPSSKGLRTSSNGRGSSKAAQQQAAEFDPAAWQQLCSWSQKMLTRLKRSRAEAAALLSKQTAANGAGDWSSSSGSRQRWDMDYVPAGGNRQVFKA